MVLGSNGRILSSLCFLKFNANETPKEQCFGAVENHGHQKNHETSLLRVQPYIGGVFPLFFFVFPEPRISSYNSSDERM